MGDESASASLRWAREWSGDWNGRGEPLADAIEAARQAVPRLNYEFNADLTWNLRGLQARYADLDEARERLGYSVAPRWAKLRLYTPVPPVASSAADDLFGPPPPPPDLDITVSVVETQVVVSGQGANPFDAQAAFMAAKKVIESHAVTKVPYYLRDTETPALSSRWTRFVVWIEKHPVLVSLALGVATVFVAVVAIVVGR